MVNITRDKQSKCAKVVGKRVLRWRTQRGIGITEFAELAKCSTGSLARLESGISKHGPTLDVAIKIAKAMGVTLDELAS